MCGLAGFYPKIDKTVDKLKLQLLAIAQEERGTDSCGISIEGYSPVHGIGEYSKARDFFSNMNLREFELKEASIIFHSRKAFAHHTKENAHPFELIRKDEEGNIKDVFTLAHNGTLVGEYDLFTTYVKPKDPDLTYVNAGIDSLIMARSMFHSSIVEVLEAYRGKAALLMRYNETFLAWKGHTANEVERPMFYIETTEGWYFSSIESVLKIIGKGKILEVENNTLLSFKGGKLADSTLIVRKPPIQKVEYYNNRNYPGTQSNNAKRVQILLNGRYGVDNRGNMSYVNGQHFGKDINSPIISNNWTVDYNKAIAFKDGYFVRSSEFANYNTQRLIKSIKRINTSEEITKFMSSLENKKDIQKVFDVVPFTNYNGDLIGLYHSSIDKLNLVENLNIPVNVYFPYTSGYFILTKKTDNTILISCAKSQVY